VRHLFLCLLVLAAVGCKAPEPAPPAVNLSGFPPAFRDGYADGCASAGGRLRQDSKRFEQDRQYASGWRDGLDACQRRNRKPAS
jgi:hypothetical protein